MNTQAKREGPLHVAIVGGGIIGLVLAIGLLRRKIEVKVYEQAQSFREIGAGIAFTANAIRCMELIDPRIPTALRSSGSIGTSNGGEKDPNDYLRWVDGYERGDPKGEDDTIGSQRLLYQIDAGYRGFEGCRRDQFLEALLKLIPTSVVELRKRLDELDDRSGDGKTTLRFHDGTSAQADAGELQSKKNTTFSSLPLTRNTVIGCDGIKSRVREILFGKGNPASYPHFTHKVAYRTLVPMEKAMEALGEYRARNQHMHIGPNAHLIHYPVADNTMVNVTAFVSDLNEWPDYKQLVAPGLSKDVETAFVGWNRVVRNLVALFPEKLDKWAVFDTWDYPAPFYNRGTICLAGDAAHASSPHHGTGACMGIEDVLCLCRVIDLARSEAEEDSRPDVRALIDAFSTYDAVRRTRTQWLVNSSRRVCDLYQQCEWADTSKLIKAATNFEEIKDRSLKLWLFDYDTMVEEAVQGYRERRTADLNNQKKVSRK